MLRYLFEQEGLDHRPIPFNGWTREYLIILEESTGQQDRFGMPGPHLSVSELATQSYLNNCEFYGIL